jgi:hypothetical protein
MVTTRKKGFGKMKNKQSRRQKRQAAQNKRLIFAIGFFIVGYLLSGATAYIGFDVWGYGLNDKLAACLISLGIAGAMMTTAIFVLAVERA